VLYPWLLLAFLFLKELEIRFESLKSTFELFAVLYFLTRGKFYHWSLFLGFVLKGDLTQAQVFLEVCELAIYKDVGLFHLFDTCISLEKFLFRVYFFLLFYY